METLAAPVAVSTRDTKSASCWAEFSIGPVARLP